MIKKEFIIEVNSADDGDILICQPPKDLFPPIPVKKELIRCKDCKYWKLERYVGGEGMACQFMPSDGNVNLTPPTGYCCWAERKEK